MNDQTADAKREHKESRASHANGASRTEWNVIARRASEIFKGFPTNLEEQMKRNPYATLAIACAVGGAAGVLLGTRILRTVVASAVSYGALELGRSFLRQVIAEANGSSPTARSASHGTNAT